MSHNLYQLSPSPPPPLDMNATLPRSSSHGTSASPPINHNLQTPIPIYQRNPPAVNDPWMPYNPRFGFPQTHANPVWSGDQVPFGRPGGYVRPSPFSRSFLNNKVFSNAAQNVAHDRETFSGSGSTDPLVAELTATNRLLQRRIAELDQQLAEIK